MPSKGRRTKLQLIKTCYQQQQQQVLLEGSRVQQQVLQVLLLCLVSCRAALPCSCRGGSRA
jgi:hypothetical protein